MRGVDLPTLQYWMGHRDIDTTMKYAHLAPSHRRAQIEKLVDTPQDTEKVKVAQIAESKIFTK
jgi:integrase